MVGRSLRTARLLAHLLVICFAALALLALPVSPLPVSAQTSAPQKIVPALQAVMTANPLQLQPIILEMTEASPPFSNGSNLTPAQQAVSILQANGQGGGAPPSPAGPPGSPHPRGV